MAYLHVLNIYLLLAASLISLICVGFSFDLTILHTNDVHARFEEHNNNGGSCKPDDSTAGRCFGGVARRMTKVKEIRQSTPNVLLLDGGDQFQGTLWFFIYKGLATWTFMNKLGYDAMALGNHEFDNGVDGLLPFLQNANASVVSSNIDASQEPRIQGLFTKSVVKTIDGERIGIIGYTVEETPELSSPAPLTFSNEVQSVQAEVDRLKALGINKIIAVGHSGFSKDKEIAMKVQDVDIVVGGHTNTFLYTGTPPSTEVPAGPYPTVVNQTNGDSVLVVQDYTFGKYLGKLQVTFDANGKITSYSGNPVLLDANVTQDNETLREIEEMARAVTNASHEVLGRTNVFLNGRVCRIRECNMGNMITDALVHQNLRHPDGEEWNHVAVALYNSGGIRISFNQGQITVGDVLTVAPFRNEINIVELAGDTILKALEHSVESYRLTEPGGAFLQVSGLRVAYNLDKPVGRRVVSVDALCTKCKVPMFEPLNRTAVYKLVINAFIARGGDGYSVIRDNIIKYHYIGDIDSDIIVEYIRTASPIYHGLEGRISFISDPVLPSCPPPNIARGESVQHSIILLAITLLSALAG